jgi:hypothetical protein
MNTPTFAPSSSPATLYYVVALKSAVPPDQETIVPCRYFNALGKHVSSKNLETEGNSDCIQFLDPGTNLPQPIQQYLVEHQEEHDPAVSLFAAVAKTFAVQRGLPQTFVACEDQSTHHRFIDIPVARQTTRGVVLVFRTPSAGGTHRLIATADPEIRNGSGL